MFIYYFFQGLSTASHCLLQQIEMCSVVIELGRLTVKILSKALTGLLIRVGLKQ